MAYITKFPQNTRITTTEVQTSNLITIGNSVQISDSSVLLGEVSNVRINGGTAGQILSTDGSGMLTWISGGISQYSGNVNTVNAVAGNVDINSVLAPGVVPANGDLFLDTSPRVNNVQPIYIYINNGWRQLLTASGA